MQIKGAATRCSADGTVSGGTDPQALRLPNHRRPPGSAGEDGSGVRCPDRENQDRQSSPTSAAAAWPRHHKASRGRGILPAPLRGDRAIWPASARTSWKRGSPEGRPRPHLRHFPRLWRAPGALLSAGGYLERTIKERASATGRRGWRTSTGPWPPLRKAAEQSNRAAGNSNGLVIARQCRNGRLDTSESLIAIFVYL